MLFRSWDDSVSQLRANGGSHVKLTRFEKGSKQVLLISKHKELKTGAIVGIFRQTTQYISEDDLRPYFYSE
jgi:predicted RNA binding protein YcfA (HicA-like mRNA interferase family)